MKPTQPNATNTTNINTNMQPNNNNQQSFRPPSNNSNNGQMIQENFGPQAQSAIVSQVMMQNPGGSNQNQNGKHSVTIDYSALNLLDQSRDNNSATPVYNYGRQFNNSSYKA